MPLQLVSGQRGQDHLIHQGYRYVLKRVCANHERVWRCAFYKTRKCRGTCVSSADDVVGFRGEHNHAPSNSEVQVRWRLFIYSF
jgi:hypothetical protein